MAAAEIVDFTAGRVLVVGEPRVEGLIEGGAVAVPAPRSAGELRGAIAADAPFDGAVIAGWDKDVDLVALVDAVRRAVEVGGRVAFVAPVTQRGWRRARSSVIGMLRRQRPIPLEDLCGALLRGRLVDVRARPLEGAVGHAIVWAVVPPRWREDVERSEVRPSGG